MSARSTVAESGRGESQRQQSTEKQWRKLLHEGLLLKFSRGGCAQRYSWHVRLSNEICVIRELQGIAFR